MAFECVNGLTTPHIPQFDFSVFAGSGKHLMQGMVAHAENGCLMSKFSLVPLGNKVFGSSLPVPYNDTSVLGSREYLVGCDLYGGNTSGVSLVTDGLLHFYFSEVVLLVLV
jgi:hypothetical protein